MDDSCHHPTRADRYFFTVRLNDPCSDLLVRRIGLLRDTVRLVRQARPFVIEGAVILPSRLHMIWSLPPDDDDYRARWQLIKTTFARHAVRHRHQGLWQRRFWEQPIRTREEWQFYLNAIAAAPVEEGLVRDAKLWPYSSLWPGRKPLRLREQARAG